MHAKGLAGVALLIGFGAGTLAADPPMGLDAAGSAAVRTVVDGHTLVLDDGRTVRLAAIEAPRSPSVPAAGAALAELVLAKTVVLAVGPHPTDRYGRLIAHVFDPEGRWIQAELVTRGLARVRTTANTRAGAGELLAFESAARRAGIGLWRHPAHRIMSVAEANRFIDSFQLVEGRVRDVQHKGGHTWLNFGDDWRQDFTISVSAPARRLFRAAGLDLADYDGKMIRVRGWIESRNGPLIEVTHPEQIEVIQP